jgi:hypothetical protein
MENECVYAMFGVNYDDNYDTMINRVINHINYSGTGGSGGVVNDNNGGGNGGVNADGDNGDDSNRTNDDDDDDSDENKDENCTDDEDESFWLREFDRKKLLLCTAGALYMYYATYVYKKPCMVSYNTRMRWLNEVVRGH